MKKKNNANNKTNQTIVTYGKPIEYNESFKNSKVQDLENLENKMDKLRTKPVAEVQVEHNKNLKKNQLK